MTMCESLHHTSPLPSPGQNQEQLQHINLTDTSLTLPGQCSGILGSVLMFLQIRGGISGYVIPLFVIAPVIIAARQEITSAMINP